MDDRGVELKLIRVRLDGKPSPAMAPVLGDALRDAGYEVEWIADKELTPRNVHRPTVVVGDLAMIDYLATEVEGWPDLISWLPVAFDPSPSEIATARKRYGSVLVAPGKLSQVVALVDVLVGATESLAHTIDESEGVHP